MLNSETFKIKNKSFNLMHHVPLTRLGVGLDHCKVGINLHFSTDRVSGQKHHIVRTLPATQLKVFSGRKLSLEMQTHLK